MKRETKETLQEIEEIECVRAYDAAKKSGETPVPYEQVLKRIARERGRVLRSGTTKKHKSQR